MFPRSETITSGSMRSFDMSQPSYSMLPDNEGFRHMPTATAMGAENYQFPRVPKQTNDNNPLRAWKRLDWLLKTFQQNGQNCDTHTAIEATFRGDDLHYSKRIQPQPLAVSGLPDPEPTCTCCSVIKHTNNYY